MSQTPSKKILIAEDDLFITRAYMSAIKSAGYEIESAVNGEEALEKIRANRPDLVILDLMMPVMNGFEFLEAIKADPELKDISVITLTNLGSESDMEKCLGMGAVDYMVKSNMSIKEVVEKITEHV